MKIERVIDITEMAISTGPFPEYSDTILQLMLKRLAPAQKVIRIRDGCDLCRIDNYFVLKKHDEVIGWMMVSDTTIAGTPYKHVDMFYIVPQYRKTGAGQWLFFAVRNQFSVGIVADNGISKGGEGMIISGKVKGYNNMYVLNKTTGEKTRIHDLIIDDPKSCYLFECAYLPFGIPAPGFEEPPTFYEYFDSF